MTVDAQQAAMLVRATARLSAVIVAGNLLAATRRAEAVGSSTLRTMDVATFVAFLVWLVFFQAYALRLFQSWLFAALAMLLAYSVAGFLRAALRSEPSPSS